MFIDNIGSLSAPILIFTILMFAIYKKIDIFNSFIEGAKEGIQCIISILPAIIAMITAVTVLNSSGIMNLLKNILSPIIKIFKIPPECIPLIIMKPISGSGSNAILASIFNSHGPDSPTGILSSTISGSSEAIFYIVSTYCGNLNPKFSGKIIIFSLTAFTLSVLCSLLII